MSEKKCTWPGCEQPGSYILPNDSEFWCVEHLPLLKRIVAHAAAQRDLERRALALVLKEAHGGPVTSWTEFAQIKKEYDELQAPDGERG